MRLAVVFRLSLYGLTAFASWMLGRAEEGWVPYLTFPVLVAAFVVTETRQNWSLPAWLANLLGAAAVLAAGVEFAQEGQLAKLLSGAHLLVYATWIVMFQEKTIRNYWWLMGLGVLQIAVASVQANENNPSFGLFLVLYVCGALWTMIVAALYQAQLQFTAAENNPDDPPAERRVLQYDGREQWITGRLLLGVAGLTVLSLIVSAAFFAFTPRIWIGPQNVFGDDVITAGLDVRSQTGFAESVRLGEIGQILESIKTVMEVRAYDAQSGQPVDLPRVADKLGMDEPLFRGTVLTHYEDGYWSRESSDRPVPRGRSFHQPGYRIDVMLEPTGTDVLFTMGLPDACRIDLEGETAYLSLSTGVLVRQTRTDNPERLNYSLMVRPLDPELARQRVTVLPGGLWWQTLESGYLQRALELPDEGLDRLRQFARQLIAVAEAQAGQQLDNRGRSLALERHFLTSGRYGYTLNLSVVDPQIDPVEDFLFNRREGHCEYFATALALMLRAVGVPSRVVSGFKGAERNTLKGCWEVQECHAHLWVEAWVGDNLWMTLDPTPAASRNESLAEVAARVGFWGRMRATTSTLWTDYVVNVNLKQQRRQLYEPLRDFVQKLWLFLQQGVGWGPAAWSYLIYLLTHPSEWFSLSGGLATFGLLAVAYGLGRLVRWLWRLGWGSFRADSWSRRRQRRLVVAFYERFLNVVRRLGLRRAATQTPREFAALVVEQFREILAPQRLEGLPLAVCAAYYRVRFGGETLTAAELQSLEQELARFEGELQRAR
jgi:transglutaminase-like putative cysteine protease